MKPSSSASVCGTAPRLKRAAVLLFHPKPHRFFMEAGVKIGAFRCAELLYQDEIRGDLFTTACGGLSLRRGGAFSGQSPHGVALRLKGVYDIFRIAVCGRGDGVEPA